MACLVATKFTMLVDVLHQAVPSNQTKIVSGHYEYHQDEDSGAIVRVWVEDKDNDPSNGIQLDTIPCEVRGVVDGGIRVAGTTERYTKSIYEAVDFAKMKFPAQVIITRRDRITRVRSMKRPDQVIWLEEESDDRPTTFDVLGVTPITDPFGNHVENMALLQRSETQDVVPSA